MAIVGWICLQSAFAAGFKYHVVIVTWIERTQSNSILPTRSRLNQKLSIIRYLLPPVSPLFTIRFSQHDPNSTSKIVA